MARAMTGLVRHLRMCAALLCACLAACGFADETPTYRYRLMVEVDTPEGLKTGSSVIEVDTDRGSSAMNPAGTALRHKVRGEAVAVDLPDGRVLFALLRSEQDVGYASNIMFQLAPKGSNANGDQYLGRYAKMLRMRYEQELPPTLAGVNRSLRNFSGRPMLVTFADLSDPTSVALVDPDDLAATFGEGVSLRRITVAITEDPVTEGIEERLGWLPDYYDKMLDGRRINNSRELANNLNQGAFSQGILQ